MILLALLSREGKLTLSCKSIFPFKGKILYNMKNSRFFAFGRSFRKFFQGDVEKIEMVIFKNENEPVLEPITPASVPQSLYQLSYQGNWIARLSLYFVSGSTVCGIDMARVGR